jgi:hypothetical protein
MADRRNRRGVHAEGFCGGLSMDGLFFYDKLLKTLRERQEDVSNSLCSGIVPDYTAFQVLRGRLSELALIEQEVKLLLEKYDG